MLFFLQTQGNIDNNKLSKIFFDHIKAIERYTYLAPEVPGIWIVLITLNKMLYEN